MTNEYIKSYLSKYVIHGQIIPNIGIQQDMYKFIDENYQWANCADGTWYKVHCVDHDSKYGSFMINPDHMTWRNCDLNEFYGRNMID